MSAEAEQVLTAVQGMPCRMPHAACISCLSAVIIATLRRLRTAGSTDTPDAAHLAGKSLGDAMLGLADPIHAVRALPGNQGPATIPGTH
jgi:hypothetical protein